MKVSIIIPTFQEERAIGTSIQHLKSSLTMPNEVIISDGRSTDKTQEIARAHADKLVVYAGTAKHIPSIGRNDGAKVASGEFLLFLDADSFLEDPDKLLRVELEKFERDPNLLGIAIPQRTLPDKETWADRISWGMVNLMNRLLNNVLQQGSACGKFMLVRKSAFDAVGGFREDLAAYEDVDFFKRIRRIGKTLYDPSFFVFHGARRAHAIGWPRLWLIWSTNVISAELFNRAASKEWKAIR
jgi:glycosyltransferase involved in cell wall biosynthesis